jgi:metal-responsive CopG/Arc/MetJ family transcriptional regulator
MKRGSVRKRDSELVALWIPKPIVDAIDRAVITEDSDRSKFIRRAVRTRIESLGLSIAA